MAARQQDEAQDEPAEDLRRRIRVPLAQPCDQPDEGVARRHHPNLNDDRSELHDNPHINLNGN
jgi:hypothetical protein